MTCAPCCRCQPCRCRLGSPCRRKQDTLWSSTVLFTGSTTFTLSVSLHYTVAVVTRLRILLLAVFGTSGLLADLDMWSLLTSFLPNYNWKTLGFLFSSDRSSRNANVCVSVCPAQSALEQSIFIFLGQRALRALGREFREHSENEQRALRVHLESI